MRFIFSVVLSTLLLWVTSLPAHSQSPGSYGIKAGFTSSSISTDMFADEIKRREGLLAVAFAEWFNTSYFSLLAELGYVQRGYNNTVEFRDPDGQSLGQKEGNLRFDYLTLSVLPKLQYSGSTLQPYVLAGSRGDVLLRGESSRSNFDPLVDQYDMVALGGIVGVGIETGKQISPVPVFVEVRYNADITDSLSCCPRDIRNNAFDILLGVEL